MNISKLFQIWASVPARIRGQIRRLMEFNITIKAYELQSRAFRLHIEAQEVRESSMQECFGHGEVQTNSSSS